MALSSRDFQRAAAQRLTTAEFLLRNRYNLDAMCLGGYTIECTLKALILKLTPDQELAETSKMLSSGSRMHSAETLGEILKKRGRALPLELSGNAEKVVLSAKR
jgi:hypothetical protein